MIVVIADDLSGAAELAGLAHAHGLTAEIHTRAFDPASTAGCVAVDTDTRSLPANAAAARLAAVASQLCLAKPALLYKKTDSVLRGNIVPELRALLETTPFHDACLIPANPSRDRIIRNGTYLVGGVPLDQSIFKTDPEHPATTALVRTRLGLAESDTTILTPDIPDTQTLRRIASNLPPDTLPAGAADFFQALLDLRIPRRRLSPRDAPIEKTLFLCGSPTGWKTGREQSCHDHNIPVVLMPRELFSAADNAAAIVSWSARITSALHSAPTVMAAIGHLPADTSATVHQLTARMADTIARVLGRSPIARLCLEGGATARAVIDRLSLACLSVHRQLAPGIVALTVANPRTPMLVIKPGSYPWPANIWQSQS